MCSLAAFLVGLEPAALAAPDSADLGDLPRLSLEELLNQEVTAVTRTSTRLVESASAVQVIHGEDVRSSAATTLPEALQLAPNLHVAAQNGHDWAISARGFNGAPLTNSSLADKSLVMIDGRSVYTPLFAGVFWDVQNVLLEDLDHIEVVSGPGASVWGSNAVNGVISVVTKSAKDTQGTYISGAGGSFLNHAEAVRYGGSAGDDLYYRIYGQRIDRGHTGLAGDGSAGDESNLAQGGFRLDYAPGTADTLTLQGDMYAGSEGDPRGASIDGQNLLGRWTRTLSDQSAITVQSYFDRTWRRLTPAGFADELSTFDLDVQHRFNAGSAHTVVWGGDWRLMNDQVSNSEPLAFTPAHRDLQLFSTFVQDEIALLPDRLHLTVGSKVEHNDFSGFEIEPTARLAWQLDDTQMLWAAVSRAARSPARLDTDAVTPGGFTPNHQFESEKLIAYELGYRARPCSEVILSAATFLNRYRDLRSVNANPNPPPALFLANDQRADSWGLELSADYRPSDRWRLRGGYTYFDKNISVHGLGALGGSGALEGVDPKHHIVLHSILTLPHAVEFDTIARYVSSLPPTEVPTPSVPGYFELDLRLAWMLHDVEFSVVGQNLIGSHHREFGVNEIPRGVYGKVALRF